MSEDWENGLFSCFNDCTTCILVYFFPCYIFGKNAESVGESCCLFGTLVALGGMWSIIARCYVRGKVRDQRGIKGTAVKDFCTIYWCGRCAICQEAQEIKARGKMTMARE